MTPGPLPPPSPFLLDVLPRLVAPGPTLDLACGRGRNARAMLERGATVVGIDRSASSLRELRTGAAADGALMTVRADLEAQGRIPIRAGTFGRVIVFRYLHRPLAHEIECALRPGGWLVYETFTRDQAGFEHGPSRPEFLLEPGELPDLFPGLRVERFEELRTEGDRPEALARLVAQKAEA